MYARSFASLWMTRKEKTPWNSVYSVVKKTQPATFIENKIHHRGHRFSQSISTHIRCHSERSEESREHTRGCTRDPSSLTLLWMTRKKTPWNSVYSVVKKTQLATRNFRLHATSHFHPYIPNPQKLYHTNAVNIN